MAFIAVGEGNVGEGALFDRSEQAVRDRHHTGRAPALRHRRHARHPIRN